VRDGLIALILLIIMVLNLIDVTTDVSLGVPVWHILFEVLIVCASGFGVVLLIKDLRRRTLNIAVLKKELTLSEDKLRSLSSEMKNARHEYSVVIQNQFKDWSLTAGEQEVAMLLLKGLSFREIAGLRNTKEKTVRQQASVIYGKANVDGRHDFAAWFLEDFMQG